MNPEPTLPAVGLHPGVDFKTYQSWDAANHSLLKHFARTPLHARHAMDNPKEVTQSLRMGHALHVATFEPARFVAEFTVIPECNCATTEGKTKFVAVIQDIVGREIPNAQKMRKDDLLTLATEEGKKTILDDGDYADLRAMGTAIRGSKAAAKFIDAPGECEVSCLWQDPVTDLYCKGRFDKLAVPDFTKGSKVIVELKSTRDASGWAFGKDAAQLHYPAQAGHYLQGLSRATGQTAMHVIIAVENAAPYGVAVYTLSDDALTAGMFRSAEWLESYAGCLKTNLWPGYPDKVEVLDIPGWAKMEVA